MGAFLTDDPCLCPRCNLKILDRTAKHGLCCAAPEGTHGHYTTRDAILHLTHLADPSASTEITELIPSAPALRPADIFSSAAFPGSMAALDIGICSPDASGAGRDCCESMWQKKRAFYSDYLEELRTHGIKEVVSKEIMEMKEQITIQDTNVGNLYDRMEQHETPILDIKEFMASDDFAVKDGTSTYSTDEVKKLQEDIAFLKQQIDKRTFTQNDGRNTFNISDYHKRTVVIGGMQ